MTESDVMLGIGRQLLTKTRDRKANWFPDPSSSTSWMLILDNAVLKISMIVNAIEADVLKLSLFQPQENQEPKVVAEICAYVPGEELLGGQFSDQDNSALLMNLYQEASVAALKLSPAFSSVTAALASDSPVGYAPTEPAHAR